METTVISHQGGKVRLQIDIDISGSLLDVEECIQEALDDVGCKATRLAIAQFDTDGSPVMTGPIKWPRRCCNLKTYQTPYGGVSGERNVYLTHQGSKVFVSLEDKAWTRCVAPPLNWARRPRFARMLNGPSVRLGDLKYARLNASGLCNDLLRNLDRQISCGTVQLTPREWPASLRPKRRLGNTAPRCSKRR